MNGLAAQVMWVSQDGWAALTFADGAVAGENWEIRDENLRKFCPLDEGGYWAALWDSCFSITRSHTHVRDESASSRSY